MMIVPNVPDPAVPCAARKAMPLLFRSRLSVHWQKPWRRVMSNDPHKIFVCTTCRHNGQTCHPGYGLICKLKSAMAQAVPVVGDEFEISGTADMESCSRPCTLAFKATDKAIYLFGDIEDDTDIDDLVDYANRYRQIENGCEVTEESHGKRWSASQGRLPAAMIVSEADGTAFS